MLEKLAMPIEFMAGTSQATTVMRAFVAPVERAMSVLAALVCVFFLINGGVNYMTSTGNPDKLEHAKKVIRNALIGLVVVLAAGALTEILIHAYASSSAAMNAKLPRLTAIPPTKVSNGLVDILIKAITGLLNNIIQSLAQPFLKALSFFTTSTPLMVSNSSVFNLWLVLVGITDTLFVLVIGLLGFQVMSLSTFGFEEIELKHLLPRIGLIFLSINVSIFAIDGIIELSNVMIRAISTVGGGSASVWMTLTDVVRQAGSQGVAALLIMVAFLIFAAILLVYYVGRLVTLYIGAVLAPLALLLWLIPGFRAFSETAAKTYLTTIFVLFIHVVILQLAASLFAAIATGSPGHTPDTLMAMIIGLATLIALLKTQGVMTQFSYVSIGARSARKLGSQFITGVSYLGGKGRAVARPGNGRSKPLTHNPAGGAKRIAPASAATSYMQPSTTTASKAQLPAPAKNTVRSKSGAAAIVFKPKLQAIPVTVPSTAVDPTRIKNSWRSKL